jgi:hypothetical protein
MAAKDDSDHSTTVVLDDSYHQDIRATASGKLENTSCARTRVVSEELVVDGDRYAWWCVGNGPVLVTVSHPVFGRKAEFTEGDPRRFAESLARQLLAAASET